MALSPKNWALDTYTDDTWTDVVAEAAIVSTFEICNTTAGTIILDMRVEDGGSVIADIVSGAAIGPNESYVLDGKRVLTGTQALQVRSDAPGLSFFGSGVVTV